MTDDSEEWKMPGNVKLISLARKINGVVVVQHDTLRYTSWKENSFARKPNVAKAKQFGRQFHLRYSTLTVVAFQLPSGRFLVTSVLLVISFHIFLA